MKNQNRIIVSVIIPTYNSWRTLERTVRSIKNQTFKPYEIIVIDNGSTDNTSQSIKNNFSKVKLITLKNNTGVTGGRNTGIKASNKYSHYLLFLDHDIVADKNMLKKLLEVAQSSLFIGIVTPKIYYLTKKKKIWSAGTSINLITGRIFFRSGLDVDQYAKNEEVQVAPAVMLVKRKVIKKIGIFDNRYFAIYEDTDFCFRARQAGFKTFYAAKATAYHDLSDNPKDEANRLLSRAYYLGRNRVLFMKKFSSHFVIFSIIFLPLFIMYYLSLSLKHHRINDWFKFVAGTINGLVNQ